MNSRRHARVQTGLAYAAETAIILASLAYVITGQLAALIAWEAVALIYLTIGGVLVWRMPARQSRADRRAAGENRRWAWVVPLLSSVTGAYSAVLALIARNEAQVVAEVSSFAVAAIVGVVLSWLLLQVGFANIYRYTALEAQEQQMAFPGTMSPAPIDFLYFAFTIGTTFATSDVNVLSSRVRRVVLVHGVVAFFYNALVIAIAIQVLQFVLSG
ncbi:DUF1345 domain-containing protein [Microbacterium sp. PF5]|uniref:DUF1345 domain-containing protein n=1 Tax=Microbacterium sp. PF5 TaxID=2305435 RepID=UPI00109BB48E|nr:DUF1345 domain-containing protein [Microbacterium sp. PF5]